jgi:hypothetical protein
MANTVIQFKQSFINAAPISLNVGEPAYSYVSNTLFIGTPDNAGFVKIGGFSEVLRLDEAYNHANSAYRSQNATGQYANSAFIHANAAYLSQNASGQYANGAYAHANSAYANANGAFAKSNAAYIHANSAYIETNAAFFHANSGFIKTNSAFIHANSAYSNANGAFAAANAAYIQANSAFIKTNSAFGHANAAYQSQNATGQYANSAFIKTNSAFGHANSGFIHSNAAFERANNSLSANVGGTITGDVTISGNLVVVGNTTYVNSSQTLIADNILTLNAAINQASAPVLNAGIEIDRGIDANVYVLWNETIDKWTVTNDGTNYYGIASDAAESYANSGFIKANAAFDHANSGYQSQNATGQYANAAFIHANSAYQSQNASGQYANAAFTVANGAFIHANAAYISQNATGQYANSAFIKTNSAFGHANSGFIHANAAFNHANAAYVSQNASGQYANAAFIRANNSLNANVGGQVTGDVTIVGNVTSNTLTTTGSNGSISGANAIFTNYIFAANGNVDLYLYSSNAYANANGGFAKANAAFIWANAAYNQANTDKANLVNSGYTAQLHSNGAFALPGNLIFGPSKARITNEGVGLLAITANSGNTGIVLDDASQAILYGKTSVLIQTNQGLFDSPTRSFTFTQDGTITLPASRGDIGRSGFPNGIDLYNNNGGAGYVRMNFADESVMWVDPGGAHIQTTGGITSNTWDFGTDGQIRFPDTTKQFTAFIGYGVDNVARFTSNSAFIHANSAYESQNATGQYANAAFIHANSAYESQNATGQYANAAYVRANNSLDANNGGTVTGFVNVTQNVSIGTYLDLATDQSNPTRVEGRVFYDNTQHALAYYNESDMTFQIGQEAVLRVWNNTGATIADGKPVYITNDSSANGFPSVALASAATANTAEFIGLTTTSIANSGFGYVTTLGKVNGLNTSLFTEGQELFLSDTPGQYQTSPAASPSVPLVIGYVVVSDVTNGSIYVHTHLMEGRNKTNGAILFARDGVIDQDPTTLYWDYANNSLGVGTATPQANLHVTGSGLFTGNVTISGNLNVTNANFISTSELTVTGNTIVMNNGATGIPTLNAEIIVNRGSSSNAYIRWDESINEWTLSEGDATNYHILTSGKTADTWDVYNSFDAYEKRSYPIGANLSKGIDYQANAAFATANIAEIVAISGFIQANAGFGHANAAYLSQNATGQYANSAFVHANSAFTYGNATANYANSAFIKANASFDHANAAFAAANNVFPQIQPSYDTANAAFIRANNSLNANVGGTVTGNVVVIGNVVATALQTTGSIDANAVFANYIFGANGSIDLTIYANNAYANANAGFAKANGAYDQANAAFIQANLAFTTPDYVANSAASYANSAFLQANTPSYVANSAASYANSAFETANSASVYANSAFLAANVADGKAVASGNYANGAFLQANAAITHAQSSFEVANSAAIYANGAFTAANVADSKAVASGNYANAAFTRANNSLDANNGGSVSGTILSTANVRAVYVVANSGFTSAAGGSKLELTDIGLVTVDVASQQFKFGASGIESSPGIYGGSFGGNRLSLSNETNLISNRYDVVKIQTGTDGTTPNEWVFSNNSLTAPGGITANGFTAGGINVVPTLSSSYNTANAAFNHANASYEAANNVFPQIQPAFNTANAAFIRANNSLNANVGGQITGDVTITGNLVIVGNTVYANAQTVLIADNIITLNAAIDQSAAPTMNAGIEVDRGNQPNVALLWNETIQSWQFTNDGSTYESFGGGSAGVYANAAFIQANAAFAVANAANAAAANGGSVVVTFATTPPATANANGHIWIDADDGTEYMYFKDGDGYQWVEFGPSSSNVSSNTFINANITSTLTHANAAYTHANAASQHANASFEVANVAASLANSAYAAANNVTSDRLSSNLKLSIIQVLESANIYTTAIGGNVNIDIGNNTSYFFSANTTANVTFNLRGNAATSFDTTVSIGQTASVAIALKQGATKYKANVYIDGVLQTPYWLGNAAPGYATTQQQSIDVYTYTVFKTAASTYSILAANSNFGLAQGQPGQG